MKPFAQSSICLSRKHCLTCRMSEAFRARRGGGIECPEGWPEGKRPPNAPTKKPCNCRGL